MHNPTTIIALLSSLLLLTLANPDANALLPRQGGPINTSGLNSLSVSATVTPSDSSPTASMTSTPSSGSALLPATVTRGDISSTAPMTSTPSSGSYALPTTVTRGDGSSMISTPSSASVAATTSSAAIANSREVIGWAWLISLGVMVGTGGGL